MLNINDWRVMYEGQEQDMAKLRASLHDLEKRHAEKTAALEIAYGQRDKDREDTNKLAAALEVERRELDDVKKNREASLQYCVAVILKREAIRSERDAARVDAARLREHLGLLVHAVNVMVSTEYGNSEDEDTPLTVRLLEGTTDAARAALATPGPTIGEIKAEAIMEAIGSVEEKWGFGQAGWNPFILCSELSAFLNAEAARLRGGGK